LSKSEALEEVADRAAPPASINKADVVKEVSPVHDHCLHFLEASLKACLDPAHSLPNANAKTQKRFAADRGDR
jgi:hypothetical protein